ncbi:MAG: DUF1330 domain-containing protein [Pseudomonadota bacterium]
MPVYLIAQITIHDRSSYDKYDDGFFEVWEKYDGEVLSVDEAPTILDGDWSATRSVLLSFPSKEAAMAWATSPEYIELAKHRVDGAETRSIMVEGFAGEIVGKPNLPSR